MTASGGPEPPGRPTASDRAGGAAWGARASLIGALVASTCCALPVLLVALGFGGALASVVSAAPAVTWLSAHKLGVFLGVGALLLASWSMVSGRVPVPSLRARLCPAGAAPRRVRRLWQLAALLYGLSLAVAYLGAPLLRVLER
jgi:hypothetical protein